jgi:hypothetical protein
MIFPFPLAHFAAAAPTAFVLPVTSGLILFLDGSDPTTITQSGSKVSKWADKSGLANHALQATGGNQPAFGSATIGGKSTVTFDDSSSMMSLTTPVAPIGTTGFAVVSYPNLSGTGPILGQVAGSNTLYWGVYNTIPEYFLVDAGGLGVAVSGDTAATAYGYTSASSGSDPQTLYVNGSALSSGVDANTSLGATTFDTIGHRLSTEWLNGSAALIAIYDRVLSGTEINSVSAAIRSYWGTP